MTTSQRSTRALNLILDDMADAFIQCRDFGHAWRPYSARWDTDDRCYVQQLRCPRCKTIRERRIGRHGQLLGSWYDYPEGYVMPSGMGRMTGSDRDLIRERSILKLVPIDTVED